MAVTDRATVVRPLFVHRLAPAAVKEAGAQPAGTARGPDAGLVPLTPDLAEAYHRLLVSNQGRLARWEPWASAPLTLEGTRQHLLAGARAWLEGSQVPTAVVVAAEGGWQLVGSLQLRVSGYDQTGELGYWIDGGFEGRGLMTRAAAALLDHAFGALGLGRVAIVTMAGNERSAAVARRLGFVEEGRIRSARPVGGRRQDDVVWGILPDEWAERRR